MKLRVLDAAVFLLAAGVTVFLAARVYGGGGEAELRIQGKNGAWVYPLRDRAERIDIPGALGVTVVEISGGGARVLSSPCVNKTCVVAGTIRRRGQWIACLPNGVSLAVEGGGAELDAAVW